MKQDMNGEPLLAPRLNALGQWRPYSADEPWDHDKFLDSIPSVEVRVLGQLQYIHRTGYQLIEFVVGTPLDLPQQDTRLLDGQLQLWKCPVPPLSPVVAYDGTLLLEDSEAGSVIKGLEAIERAVNRLAFSFGRPATWRAKYEWLVSGSLESQATPTTEEMPRLKAISETSFTTKEEALLDRAMDWCNRASQSTNPLNSFLGYFVAMDGLADSVVDGPADFERGLRAMVESCV